jgi:hypothetical protein
MLGVADTHYRLDKLILLEVTFRYWGSFAVCAPLRITFQAARDEDVLSPRRRERTLQTSAICQRSEAVIVKCRPVILTDHFVGVS